MSARVASRFYSPYAHAAELGVRVTFSDALLRPSWLGAYSAVLHEIYLRPGLSPAFERTTLAHEIVHAEHGDAGGDRAAEIRADRVAAGRLIRRETLITLARHSTPQATAGRLAVITTMLGIYVKRRRSALAAVIDPAWLEAASALAPSYGERGQRLAARGLCAHGVVSGLTCERCPNRLAPPDAPSAGVQLESPARSPRSRVLA